MIDKKIKKEASAESGEKNKASEEFIEDNYSQSMSNTEDDVTKAKKRQAISFLDAVTSVAGAMGTIMPIFLACIALLIIIILSAFTYYTIIDYTKLSRFLEGAWEVTQSGSPFALLIYFISNRIRK